MSLRKFFALMFGLIVLAEQARGSRSNTPEYYYQPNVSSIALGIGAYQLLSGASSTSTGGVKQNDLKYTDTGYVLNAGYGFTDAWAIQAAMGMNNNSIQYTDSAGNSATYKSSGMTDLTMMLTNISPIGGFTLHVGLGASVSQGKRIDQSASSDGNNMSGGTTIINYVGLSSLLGSGNYYGFKAQYKTKMTRSANNNQSPSQDYTITGGNETTLGLFFQSDFTPVEVDVAGEYVFTDPSSSVYPGSTSATDASKYMVAALGLGYQITASTYFRLSYTMNMYGEASSGGVVTAAYSSSVAMAALRVEF